jgi:hypothetical protein
MYTIERVTRSDMPKNILIEQFDYYHKICFNNNYILHYGIYHGTNDSDFKYINCKDSLRENYNIIQYSYKYKDVNDPISWLQGYYYNELETYYSYNDCTKMYTYLISNKWLVDEIINDKINHTRKLLLTILKCSDKIYGLNKLVGHKIINYIYSTKLLSKVDHQYYYDIIPDKYYHYDFENDFDEIDTKFDGGLINTIDMLPNNIYIYDWKEQLYAYQLQFANGLLYYHNTKGDYWNYNMDDYKDIFESDLSSIECSYKYNDSNDPVSWLQDYYYNELETYISYGDCTKTYIYLVSNKWLMEEIINDKINHTRKLLLTILRCSDKIYGLNKLVGHKVINYIYSTKILSKVDYQYHYDFM